MFASLYLRYRVRLGRRQALDLALQAKVDRATLSLLVNQRIRVKPGDERVLRIAKVLNIPESEAFSDEG